LIVSEQISKERHVIKCEAVPSLEQMQAMNASNSLGAALDAQFAVDMIDVALHRADGDDQLTRHGSIRQARY
jgi:hypothetical protein